MSETGRLERLVADEVGDCCADDVAARLDELEALADGVPDPERDLAALSALASETRYRLCRLLVAGGERCVCELHPVLDVSESATSHALSTLADAGLVARREAGKWHYYRATERTETLLAALDETR
jgi:ArsR family transcriptional regulator